MKYKGQDRWSAVGGRGRDRLVIYKMKSLEYFSRTNRRVGRGRGRGDRAIVKIPRGLAALEIRVINRRNSRVSAGGSIKNATAATKGEPVPYPTLPPFVPSFAVAPSMPRYAGKKAGSIFENSFITALVAPWKRFLPSSGFVIDRDSAER